MRIPMKVEFPMPEDIRDLYTEDEHEFLIAVSDGYYGGDVYSDESLHEAQFEILGKIDLTTGKKIKGRGSASWIAAKYPNTVEYNNYFDKVNDSVKEIVHPKTIYRVKGYAPIDPVNKPLYFFLERHMNGLYISEILSFGEQDEFLQSILDMYFTKKSITSPVLGELVFNPDLMWYSAKKRLQRKQVELTLSVNDICDDIQSGLEALESFWSNKESWNERLKKYAAEYLLDMAEDWSDSEISEEEFISKIRLTDIGFKNDGSFLAYYSDGKFFKGHSIEIRGNIDSEPDSVNIAG